MSGRTTDDADLQAQEEERLDADRRAAHGRRLDREDKVRTHLFYTLLTFNMDVIDMVRFTGYVGETPMFERYPINPNAPTFIQAFEMCAWPTWLPNDLYRHSSSPASKADVERWAAAKREQGFLVYPHRADYTLSREEMPDFVPAGTWFVRGQIKDACFGNQAEPIRTHVYGKHRLQKLMDAARALVC